MSNGGTCTAEEWALSGASGVYCLTRQQNDWLVVVASAGFISLSAVLFIFALIARNVIYSSRFPTANPPVAMGRRRLIDEPMDLFTASPSLFPTSLFQALGVVLEIKWINEGRVYAGSFCTAQGVFQNLGQSAVAIQTTIITLHTFATIWWRWGVERLRTAWILVGILWLYLALFILISASVHKTPPFYYPTPYWCWIHNKFSSLQILGESVWLWFAFTIAVFLYTPLCFYNLGYIAPENWTYRINSREERAVRRGDLNLPTFRCAMAYCVPVLPTAMARWFLVVHNDAKPFATAGAQFTVKTIFSLSGVFDVAVFLLARPNNLLFERSLGIRNPFRIPAPVRNVALLAAWIALNGLDVLWIYYYIVSATDPVPRRKPNENHESWKAFYVMSWVPQHSLYFYGFLLGLVNIAVWLRYIRTVLQNTSLRPLRILKYFLRFLIIAAAVIMCLGPFFSPFIGLKIAQKTSWDGLCARFPVEVILDGRPFYALTKENPSIATFYFGQPGNRTEYYKYGMTQDDNDTNVSHLRLIDNSVTIPPDLDPVYHPLTKVLSYRFDNHSVTAICATNTSSDAVSIPCMQGSFSDGGSALNLTINDTRTGNITILRAADKGIWAPVPADDAPSVLLRDDRGNALRTAVTMEGDCTRLKLCLARERGIDLLAAVGLILKAQDNYAHTCTTPNN